MDPLTSVFREQVNYKPNFDKFILVTKNYVQQYNLLYLTRLFQMKNRLSQVASCKWGSNYRILPKIIDIESVDSEHQQPSSSVTSTGEMKQHYILIGTLYKEMTLRGSVLDEFKENNGISGAVQSLHNIASGNDSLVMEDESGRISLSGASITALTHSTLVTGIVIAAKGFVNDLGVFEVDDWVYSHSLLEESPHKNTLSILPSLPVISEQAMDLESDSKISKSISNSNSKYLLFVSGLQIGNLPSTAAVGSASSELSLQLLIDFIAGRLAGQSNSDKDIASKIVRVIIAGDSVAPIDPNAPKEKNSSFRNQKLAISPSKQLDLLLSQLLCCCPVDMMPGDSDPTNLSLPQQPLHPCLFPNSARFSSFNRVTNPYQAVFDDNIQILGTSGQNITDIARQIFDSSPETIQKTKESIEVCTDDAVAIVSEDAGQRSNIDILQDTLKYGHIAPTAPDTLPCYPYETEDPFIITEQLLPQIYFAGNQPSFETRLVHVVTQDSNTVRDLSFSSSDAVSESKQLLDTNDKTAASTSSSAVTRLVTIPIFALTGTVVLVDLSDPNFHTFTMSFR